MSGGVLLDGFPRTADQANGLEAMLADLGQELTIAINLDVPVEEVTERMMARGREDDTEEAIARRLSLYEEQTAPCSTGSPTVAFWPRSTVWARRTRCSPVSRRPSTAEWPGARLAHEAAAGWSTPVRPVALSTGLQKVSGDPAGSPCFRRFNSAEAQRRCHRP